MNNNKAIKVLVTLGGILGLCASAIVSECQRHATALKLIATEGELNLYKTKDVVNEAKIKILTEELEKTRS